MIVVDTNVIASLWVPNDMDELTYKVLKKDPNWIAPVLWRSELRSVMTIYLRKEILELYTVLQSIQEAHQLMDFHSFEMNSIQVLQLVNNSTCSSYDCEFVALAKDLDVQLVTFDKKICTEFPEIALHPEQFVAS